MLETVRGKATGAGWLQPVYSGSNVASVLLTYTGFIGVVDGLSWNTPVQTGTGVPEPASVMLMAGGLAMAAGLRRLSTRRGR